MNFFQDKFDQAIKENLTFPKFTGRIISKKFEENGITLSDTQIKQLEIVLAEVEKRVDLGNSFSLDVNDEGEISISVDPSLGEGITKNIAIDLDTEFDNAYEVMLEAIEEFIPIQAEKLSRILLREQLKTRGSTVRENQRSQRQFNRRLYSIWKKPLSLYELFIILSEDIGSQYNHYIGDNPGKSPRDKFNVLVGLHARSCQVAKEILVLLKNGFADGAHARWRTLHEISVVGNLISHHDEKLAQRYLDHDLVERYQLAKNYRENAQKLGFRTISDKEYEQLEKDYRSILQQYGDGFKTDYGWAASVLTSNPTFAEIERSIDLSHLRPFYKLACLNVHTGVRSIQFRLGLLPGHRVLLSGSSIYGLDDPIQNATHSLLLMTCNLLVSDPENMTLDMLIALNFLVHLEERILIGIDELQELRGTKRSKLRQSKNRKNSRLA